MSIAATLPARRPFTAAELDRMSEAGILGAEDRVELIEGEVVRMSPIGRRHAACVRRLTYLLTRRFQEEGLADEVLVDAQNPITLEEHSQPLPDLALVRYREDFYAAGHPRPADAFLVVEVADTTLDYDRTVKVPLYARNGVPEVWVVDLDGSAVEIHAGLSGDGYARRTRLTGPSGTVPPEKLPQLTFAVSGLLG